jgi:hypothetical protein
MNNHLFKTLPSLVEHLHLKTGILNIYGRSTHGQRHLAPGLLQPLHLLGRGRWHLLGLSGQGPAPPPSPSSLMDHLTPCTCLRKEKLLDSLLGDRRRWCWGFLGAAVDEVLGRPGLILTRRRIVRRSVTRLGTRVRSGELLPLGHKNHVVTRRRVTVHILFKIPNA